MSCELWTIRDKYPEKNGISIPFSKIYEGRNENLTEK